MIRKRLMCFIRIDGKVIQCFILWPNHCHAREPCLGLSLHAPGQNSSDLTATDWYGAPPIRPFANDLPITKTRNTPEESFNMYLVSLTLFQAIRLYKMILTYSPKWTLASGVR